jgi:sugar phosphate isomerase/epimerase
MKIATTTVDFDSFCGTDAERLRELHRAGFRYVDLSMYSLTSRSLYMCDGWRDEVLKLRELASELGMTFVQAHSQGGNPLSEDRAHVEFLVSATLRSIEVCELLGIPCTVVHSGHAKGISKEEWFERNRDFYRRLLPTAERCGVKILCENSTAANMGARYFINTGKDMREFIDYVGHPLFGGCWDTGHGNCEGAQYDEIMALGDALCAIHYNDNRGAQDEHVAPFLGTLNHDEILHALIDVGYRGYFTLECGSSLREARCWLGKRRPFEADNRLAEPQLFMQRHIERMIYETAEYILSAYGLLEE